uniref:Uncharacterized protein n=1 Tax=Setaria viridis TaxID=4556 RepID=A0A4U6TJV9_SETVI|nr:hypothetical protein SEVIR_8G166350v2 [Setaria viridis]
MEDMAREAQMEAMKALVCDLPMERKEKDVPYDAKGKGKVQDVGKAKVQDVRVQIDTKGKAIVATDNDPDVEDVWDDDDLLFDGDSD